MLLKSFSPDARFFISNTTNSISERTPWGAYTAPQTPLPFAGFLVKGRKRGAEGKGRGERGKEKFSFFSACSPANVNITGNVVSDCDPLLDVILVTN